MSEFEIIPDDIKPWSIEWVAGRCPVEAEGYIDSSTFYFRARGERWSFSVYDIAQGRQVLKWTHEEKWPGGPYAAGWMTEDDALRCIDKAAALYMASFQTGEAK